MCLVPVGFSKLIILRQHITFNYKQGGEEFVLLYNDNKENLSFHIPYCSTNTSRNQSTIKIKLQATRSSCRASPASYVTSTKKRSTFPVGFDNSVILERPAGYLWSRKPFYKQRPIYSIIDRGAFPNWLRPPLATAWSCSPRPYLISEKLFTAVMWLRLIFACV